MAELKMAAINGGPIRSPLTIPGSLILQVVEEVDFVKLNSVLFNILVAGKF